MKRLILNEDEFRKYISNGFLEKEGIKIWMKKSDIDIPLTPGPEGIVTQGDVQFILSDIGLNRIHKILIDSGIEY